MRKLFLLSVFFFMIMSGCSLIRNDIQYQQVSLDHPLADQSFLSDEPCEYPCWYGVELGKTTKEDTIIILQGLDFVEDESISTKWEDRVAYDCVYETPGNNCGDIFFSGGVAYQITYFVAFPLLIEDVIAREGDPEYAYTGTIGPSGCILSLAWPEKDLEIEYLSSTIEAPCEALNLGNQMIRGLQVTYIWYTDISQGNECGFSGVNCVDWPGFTGDD